jgi:large subunit ribosomal protein L5
MSALQQFNKEIIPALKEKLGVKNINSVPRIQKIIVSIGIGSLATRKSIKDFDEFEKNLIKITGQKPTLIKSRKSISNFKLREGMPVMYKVTLRRDRAYDFLDRFVKVVLPRLRDFSGLSSKSFDPKGNLNIGIINYNIFPELNVDDVNTPMGLQITIVTSTTSTEKSKALLQELWLLFK